MIGWLKRLAAKRRSSRIAMGGLPTPDAWPELKWHGPIPAKPFEKTTFTPIVTDWDVAKDHERPESEPGRVEYRFLGVTGEEDA